MNRYNINIISRNEAILTDTKILDNDCILVSINSKGEDHYKFRNPKIMDILYIDFDDIEPLHLKKGSKCKTMTFDQAIMIRNFIEEHAEIKNIYVHCTAGISRSAAIGFILNKYLNRYNDLYLFESGKYKPNRWVYKLMCKAFDIKFHNSDFKRKLNISSQKCSVNLKECGELGIHLSELMKKTKSK